MPSNPAARFGCLGRLSIAQGRGPRCCFCHCPPLRGPQAQFLLLLLPLLALLGVGIGYLGFYVYHRWTSTDYWILHDSGTTAFLPSLSRLENVGIIWIT